MAHVMQQMSSANGNGTSQMMTEGNVKLNTSMGDIEIELYWNHAPKTCHNFRSLAQRGYYNNTIFHRIIKV